MNTELETSEVEQPQTEKLNLSIDIKETSSCQRHITVTVPRSEIDRYFSRQFDDLVPRAELPGFRVGKAPRKLLEKKFHRQVADKVKSELLMDSLTQIQESSDFSAISEPDLDYQLVNIPDEGDLTYEFNIEVRPEFDLPEWRNLNLTRPEHDFTDSEVQAEMDRFGKLFGDLAPVDEPAEYNDLVICNLISRYEGKQVAEDTEVSVYVRKTLSLSDATIEGLDTLLVGAKSGDKRTIQVNINEFSDNEELRGKSVEVEFEILDVKRIEALNADQLAKKIGFASGEEVIDFFRNRLVQSLQYDQRQSIRNQISDQLTAEANWELPPDLLRRQSKREIERATMEMRRSSIPEYEVIARVNAMRKNILERTERLLKEHFILEKIAEDQKTDAEPGDYEAEIMRIAAQQNESPRRVRARLEREGQLDALRNMIIEQKVIDMIIENAKLSATKYEVPDETETTYAVKFFAAGYRHEIPEAKYDGGEAPAIPGTEPKKN